MNMANEKTYVLVEVEDSCLADTTVIGGGEVEVISIDWDDIPNELIEAEDKLGEVVTALDTIKQQGRKDTHALEKAELRLREIINEFNEDEDGLSGEGVDDTVDEWEEDDVVALGPGSDAE
jgi:hypothetical protein